MMTQQSINRRKTRFERKGKDERLNSPDIIQSMRALNFLNPFKIRVVNNCGATLSAFRFIKVTGYDNLRYAYTIGKPDSAENGLARLKLGQIAVLKKTISNGKPGHAYIGNCCKIAIYNTAEDIAVGDPVGPDDDTGKAIKGGPYVCLKVGVDDDAGYIWVEPNGV